MILKDIEKMTRRQLFVFARENAIVLNYNRMDTAIPISSLRNDIGVSLTLIKETPLPEIKAETIVTDNKILIRTPAGTEVKTVLQKMEEIHEVLKDDSDAEWREKDEAKKELRKMKVSPKVFFQFIKSKMESNQIINMAERMQKIVAFMNTADLLDQRGLFEELANELAILVKTQEAYASGYNICIEESYIGTFIKRLPERLIKFKDFDEFPRVIPKEKAEIIKKVKDLKIFDSFKILFVDYVNQEMKSTKKKIKEKDPILFGVFKHSPEKLFYITDWVDEYCDLTLDKLIEAIKLDDSNFLPEALPELTPEYLNSVLEGVKERQERLRRTDSSNYEDYMEEEDTAAEERQSNIVIISDRKDQSWFAKVKGFIWK